MRVQPTGFQVFPEYDLALQVRTLELLAGTNVPVPRALWFEAEDRSVLGAPFYVMARVAGRVPTDQPPYHSGGWMTEASPEERAAIWWGGIECIAKIHRLDWKALGFGFLEKPELGDTRSRAPARVLPPLPGVGRARAAAADDRGRARLAGGARAGRRADLSARGATRGSATSSSTGRGRRP